LLSQVTTDRPAQVVSTSVCRTSIHQAESHIRKQVAHRQAPKLRRGKRIPFPPDLPKETLPLWKALCPTVKPNRHWEPIDYDPPDDLRYANLDPTAWVDLEGNLSENAIFKRQRIESVLSPDVCVDGSFSLYRRPHLEERIVAPFRLDRKSTILSLSILAILTFDE